MSLKTWEAEFYPVEASAVPVDQAIAHAVTKWIGLLPANLIKHDCMHVDGQSRITDGDVSFLVDADSCALCHHYFPEGVTHTDGVQRKIVEATRCQKCPLFVLRGKPCDRSDGKGEAPYNTFVRTGDPGPMLELLGAALEAKVAADKTGDPGPMLKLLGVALAAKATVEKAGRKK